MKEVIENGGYVVGLDYSKDMLDKAYRVGQDLVKVKDEDSNE